MNSGDRNQRNEQPLPPRDLEPRDLEFWRMLEDYAADLGAIREKLRRKLN
jgi:hypothetical protein